MAVSCYLTCLSNLIVGFAIIKYIVSRFLEYWQEKKKYEKFKETPKDKVILHLFPKIQFPSNVPAPQPWPFKIELFLKLAKIDYELEYGHPFGPKGKSPWITFNGKHQQDSQLIIELLKKKFNVDMNSHYKPEQVAIARAVRVMLEERFVWCIPFWRFIWEEGREHFYSEFASLKFPFYYPLWFFKWSYGKLCAKQSWAHGIGRFSKEESLAMFIDDLRTVSHVLGDKTYISGDEICQEDCAIFGLLTQPVYGMPGSPFEKLINEELQNLKAYCERIRIKYYPEFPDWK